MFIPCPRQRGGTLDNTAESMSDDGQTVRLWGFAAPEVKDIVLSLSVGK